MNQQFHYHYYVPPREPKQGVGDGIVKGCAGCGCLTLILLGLIFLVACF